MLLLILKNYFKAYMLCFSCENVNLVIFCYNCCLNLRFKCKYYISIFIQHDSFSNTRATGQTELFSELA